MAICAVPTSHTTEKLGVLRDGESGGFPSKQQIGVVSFPGLTPDTVLMTSKPPRGTRCPTGQILLQRKPGQGWKGEMVSEWGCHSVGFGGLGFSFSACSVHPSLPIQSPTSPVTWGSGGTFLLLFLLFISSSAVGDENPQDCWWVLLFPPFWGSHGWFVTQQLHPFVPERFPHPSNPSSTEAGDECFVFSPSGFEM